MRDTDQYRQQFEQNQQQDHPAPHREARINRDTAGDPIGIGVFVSAAELRALGIDLDTTDVVGYCVRDGELRFAPPDREVTDK